MGDIHGAAHADDARTSASPRQTHEDRERRPAKSAYGLRPLAIAKRDVVGPRGLNDPGATHDKGRLAYRMVRYEGVLQIEK